MGASILSHSIPFDPHQKSLVADRGEIRIGSGYQATIPHVLEPGEPDGRGDGKKDASGVVFEELEERLWVPPVKKNREGQNGEASRSNGDSNLDDEDHGKIRIYATKNLSIHINKKQLVLYEFYEFFFNSTYKTRMYKSIE